jgi:hypothetical protein
VQSGSEIRESAEEKLWPVSLAAKKMASYLGESCDYRNQYGGQP